MYGAVGSDHSIDWTLGEGIEYTVLASHEVGLQEVAVVGVGGVVSIVG